MCYLNFVDDGDWEMRQLPQGVPRLAWAIPVDIAELGASLEAYEETLPQANALRICHRFRDCSLSKLPQEILEQIIDDVRQLARAITRPKWRRDFTCFQGICLVEDHFEVYEKHVEDMWRWCVYTLKFTIYPWNKGHKHTNEEKLEMVRNWMQEHPDLFAESCSCDLHREARKRWFNRTCLCPKTANSTHPGFGPLNRVLVSHFGLEALIIHEALSGNMHRWLPKFHCGENTNSTICYLISSSRYQISGPVSGRSASKHSSLFRKCGDHTAFRSIFDPSQLSLTENERLRFPTAMKRLDLKPYYHLSELESQVIHPIQDSVLKDMCCCRTSDYVQTPCHASMPYDPNTSLRKLTKFLDEKSKELEKESWPKFMCIAAGDCVSPNGWEFEEA